MGVYDRHLENALMCRRGQNRRLAEEIVEKISEEGKERLFRILQDFENELRGAERKARMPWVR